MSSLLRPLAVAFLLSFLLHAPVDAGPKPRLVPFDESEYLPYGGDGTALITGQAFVPTNDGNVVVGAGRQVHLVPVTPYSTEWWERAVLAREKLAPADSVALTYTRITTANAQGDFRFEDLPAGSYYVFCYLQWQSTATLYGFSSVNVNEEAYLGAKVEAKDGEETEVTLEALKKQKKK